LLLLQLSGIQLRWRSLYFFDLCLDAPLAAMQHCGMTAIPVSKRGTITLPPEIRRGLGLETAEHPMMLVELRDGGVFLQPAEALPVRDIPETTLRGWIAEDERDAEGFWKRAGKA
jgi:bifunctional DNA-binding transcriptional regulator/antitoxin component of YhaV-PrlF toxin-antitoxin module